MTSQPEHPRCSLALHKKVLQYSPSIEQGRSRIPQMETDMSETLEPQLGVI